LEQTYTSVKKTEGERGDERMSLTLVDLFAAYLILATFTIVWKNNPFYVSAASFQKGVIGGIGLAGSLVLLYTTLSSAFSAGLFWRIIPLIIAILFFCSFTRYRWLTRYPQVLVTGMGLGIMTGLSLKGQILDNTLLTITQVVKLEPDPVGATLVIVGFITSVFYFTYGVYWRGRRASSLANTLRRIGIFYLAITLGNAWAAHTLSFVSSAMGVLSIIADYLKRALGI